MPYIQCVLIITKARHRKLYYVVVYTDVHQYAYPLKHSTINAETSLWWSPFRIPNYLSCLMTTVGNKMELVYWKAATNEAKS